MSFTPDELRLWQAYDRQARRASFTPEELCFPKQLAPLLSTAKRKVLRCGRRAGKTTAVAFKLLLEALKPPAVPVLYVTLTRENAREIIWGDLLELNERHGLGFKAHQSHLELTAPGGGLVQLRGAHTEREVSKYRGKKFKTVVIDEAQSFPDRILAPLVKDVIGPTLMDYQGELWIVGTPPPLRRGYFFECFAGKLASGREQFHWTVRDNERLPARLMGASVDAILKDIREEFGWSEEDPTYLREYEGADIEDLEALLYQYRAGRNDYATLPAGNWTYIFGVDIGYDDSDAIAVWGWREHDPTLYLVDEAGESGQDITDLAEQLHPLIAKYQPIRIVMDEHKKTTAEIRNRHHIPVVAAEKQGKPGYIKLFNADLRKGKVLVRADSWFAGDCGLVRKDPDALVRDVLQELPAKKGGYHSDICDAALYGWRAAGHFREPPAPPPPLPEEDKILAERLEHIRRGQEQGWLEQDAASLGLRNNWD